MIHLSLLHHAAKTLEPAIVKLAQNSEGMLTERATKWREISNRNLFYLKKPDEMSQQAAMCEKPERCSEKYRKIENRLRGL